MLIIIFVVLFLASAAFAVLGSYLLKIENDGLYKELKSPPVFTLGGFLALHRLILRKNYRSQLTPHTIFFVICCLFSFWCLLVVFIVILLI